MSPIKNVPLASAGRENFFVAVDNVEVVMFSPYYCRALTLRIRQSTCVRRLRRLLFFQALVGDSTDPCPEEVCRSSYLTPSSLVGCCSRGQIFFNHTDQLGYADRFGERWATLDVKPVFCLRSGDQRREKDYRGVMQLGVGLDLCCYFATVSLRHHDIEENHVRLKVASAVMSVGRVVLLHHQIGAGSFEEDFDEAGAIGVVINNQDAPLFACRAGGRTGRS